MVRRLLLALAALCSAPAIAGPQPADVAAYSPVAPLYKTDSTANTPIDPAITPPPVVELTNIPIPSNTGRIVTTAVQGPGPQYCTIISDGGTCNEYKFRTTIDQLFMLPDDPIRNYGQPGLSHLHCFAGAGSTNAYSTYKTLRQHGLDSAAGGADANATGYWRPCTVVLNPYGDGKNYAIRDDFWTVYYVGTPGKKTAHIPEGDRFVFGFDMDSTSPSTQFAWLQTILDTANAAYISGGGTGGNRYFLKSSNGTGSYENQVTYSCIGATPSTVNVIKNADGSDPFGGTCASGAQFYAAINGPRCADGANLWDTTGYKHVIPGVWDRLASDWVCPYNYYMRPFVRIEFTQTQYGWTDRQRWDLSSDIAYRAAKGLTTAQVPPGTTFHTDWLYGWDSVIFLQAQRNCSGADNVQGHECNSGWFSPTQEVISLSGDGPGAGGRIPQVTTTGISHVNQTDPGWMLIPPAWSGSLTNMHMHSMNDVPTGTRLAGVAPVSFDLRRTGR